MKALQKTLLVFICVTSTMHAGASKAWELTTHDFESLEPERYQVSGNDPYLLWISSQTKSNQDAVWLRLDLLSDSQGQNKKELHIYWADERSAFTSKQMMTGELKLGENRFALPLNKLGSSGNAIRLDLEQCEGCIVKAYLPIRAQDPIGEPAYPSGFAAFWNRHQGQEVAVSDWFGEELQALGNGRFGFKSWDPRLINTTRFGIPIDSLAGVYLEFDYNNAGKFHSYEVFWYLQGLPWSGLRSAHFVLENSEQDRKRVFLPFERIHSKRKLNHLRFDFEACPSCQLQLIKTRLVGHAEHEKFARYTPERLYYVHTESPPAGQIKSEIWHKLQKDWGFFLFWLVLLMGSLGGGVWRFRKAR